MKKLIKKIKVVEQDLLFPFYLLFRILKAPLFWIPISNFNRWKYNENLIKKDFIFVFFVGVFVSFFGLFSILTASILSVCFIIVSLAFIFAIMKNLNK